MSQRIRVDFDHCTEKRIEVSDHGEVTFNELHGGKRAVSECFMDGVYCGFSELEGMCGERQREEEREESDDSESEGEATKKVKERHCEL